VSQFCKDPVLVLNWERLHSDESVVPLLSLVVSLCSRLKSKKFCLKNYNKQKALTCGKEPSEHKEGSHLSCRALHPSQRGGSEDAEGSWQHTATACQKRLRPVFDYLSCIPSLNICLQIQRSKNRRILCRQVPDSHRVVMGKIHRKPPRKHFYRFPSQNCFWCNK